jgi:hypothetical protein
MKTNYQHTTPGHNDYQWSMKAGLFLSMALLVLSLGCQKEMDTIVDEQQITNVPAASNDMRKGGTIVTDWYNFQTELMLNANPQPSPVATGRFFTYEGIALYEAVRHGIPKAVGLGELLYQMPQMPDKEKNKGYSWSLTANAALAHMTLHMFPNVTPAARDAIKNLEDANNDALRPDVDSDVFIRSQAYGRAVAEVILEWSKSDGSARNGESYPPPVFPGAWVPTPAGFAPAALQYMGSYRPMLAVHLEGVIAPFPHPYSELPESEYYKEMEQTYLSSKFATAEQKATAIFWHDTGVGTGYTTPGHHVRILTSILEKTNADLGTAAIAYAKTGIASRDAFILTWRSKYTYNLMRPVTYVQAFIEHGWMPVIAATPNHPEYPAAHSVVTAAFMEAMAGLFGDNYPFWDHTYESITGASPRYYATFSEAAAEAGWARIYGGIHLPTSVEMGLVYGKQIGNNVRTLRLQK